MKLLKEHYIVYIPFFPGFCGEKEPNKGYDLDDYAKYVEKYINDNNLNIDYILGNSFGGEVAVRYKTLIDPSIKIILTVPAILRKTNNSKKFISTPKIIKPIRNKLRDLYVIYIKKTPEMKFGSKFLRQSYQKIVRYNLIDEVKKFNKEEVLILLGKHDNMVNTDKIYSCLKKEFNNIYKISGGHEIVETNSEEVLPEILKFTNN